jgi:hypothetical protein
MLIDIWRILREYLLDSMTEETNGSLTSSNGKRKCYQLRRTLEFHRKLSSGVHHHWKDDPHMRWYKTIPEPVHQDEQKEVNLTQKTKLDSSMATAMHHWAL